MNKDFLLTQQTQMRSEPDVLLNKVSDAALRVDIHSQVERVKAKREFGVASYRLPALTSLRFFAAFYVVLSHSLVQLTGWTWGPLQQFASMGFISVSFFFLLSGYILAIVYLRGDRSLRPRGFFIARLARIYPLFLATLLLDTPHLLYDRVARYGWRVSALKTAATFTAHLFMLQAWSTKFRGIDSPNWSLSVETLFYLCFPILGVVLWRLRDAQLWPSFVAIYAAGQGAVWVVGRFLRSPDADYHPLLHLSTFALGILFARWQTRELPEHSGPRVNPACLYAVVAAATAVCVAIIFYGPIKLGTNLHDGLLAPVFCAYLWAFSHSEFTLSRWLGASWLVLLGESSYGLYLIHVPLLHLLLLLHLRQSVFVYTVYLVVCIALSILGFLYFESPSRKWLLRFVHSPSRESRELSSTG